jgi:hypothetical protein
MMQRLKKKIEKKIKFQIVIYKMTVIFYLHLPSKIVNQIYLSTFQIISWKDLKPKNRAVWVQQKMSNITSLNLSKLSYFLIGKTLVVMKVWIRCNFLGGILTRKKAWFRKRSLIWKIFNIRCLKSVDSLLLS